MDRISGSLFGLAFGDALGKPTEFLTVEQIVQRYGRGGPRELAGDPALVTDDTQMALAVGWAMCDALSLGAVAPLSRGESPLAADDVEPLLRQRFVAWAQSPDNNRAPGNTCLRAVAGLAEGLPWQVASVPVSRMSRPATSLVSKGCGANMRVTPVGLLAGIDENTMANLAQLQAGLTHGHPTALAAAELTAYAVRMLALAEAELSDLPGLLRERAMSQRTTYRADWLGDLWQRAGPPDLGRVDYIARGWDECLDVLDRLDFALARADRDTDPCLQTGAGWIAEEALATALLCALLFADDPVSALARAATTSGDSDSIACLSGAMLGAASGLEIWPADWPRRIEYADHLTALAATLSLSASP